MLRIFLVATTLVLPLVGARDLHAETSPCVQIAGWSAATQGKDLGTIALKRLLSLATALFGPQEGASPEKQGLFFTVKSDYSVQPVCWDNGTSTRANGLYYPAGLVVRPIKDVVIGRKPLTLVQAEYGLHFYLPKAHLKPIEADKAYFFADGTTFPGYCPVNDRNCDWSTSATTLHPAGKNVRYGVAPLSSLTGELGLGGLRACRAQAVPPVVADMYGAGGQRIEANGVKERGALALCDGDGSRGNIKIVTADLYEQYFSRRLSGGFVSLRPGVVQRLVGVGRVTKECDVTKVQIVTKGVRAEAGVEAKHILFDFSFGGSAEYNERHEITVPADRFQKYSGYTFVKGDDSKSIRIMAAYQCMAGQPDVPQMLVIDSPMAGEKYPIRYDPVKNHMDKVNQSLAYPDIAWPALYRQGYLWYVEDNQRFFLLRDALRSVFSLWGDTLLPLMSDQTDHLEYYRLKEFFVHLVMLAGTKFGDSDMENPL